MLPLRISLSKSTSRSMPNSVPPPKPNLSVGEPDLHRIRISWVLWVVGSRDPCRLWMNTSVSPDENVWSEYFIPWVSRVHNANGEFGSNVFGGKYWHGHGLGLSVGWVGSNFWATVVGWVDSHSSSPIFVYSSSIINRIQTDRLLSCCNRRHYTV